MWILMEGHCKKEFDDPENEWSIFSDQNVPMKRPNMDRFAKILVSFDSSHSQLSNDAKIVTSRAVSRPFTNTFLSYATHSPDHSFSGAIELMM